MYRYNLRTCFVIKLALEIWIKKRFTKMQLNKKKRPQQHLVNIIFALSSSKRSHLSLHSDIASRRWISFQRKKQHQEKHQCHLISAGLQKCPSVLHISLHFGPNVFITLKMTIITVSGDFTFVTCMTPSVLIHKKKQQPK